MPLTYFKNLSPSFQIIFFVMALLNFIVCYLNFHSRLHLCISFWYYSICLLARLGDDWPILQIQVSVNTMANL